MIAISNLSGYSFRKDFLKAIVDVVLVGEGIKKDCRLSIAFVPPREMKRLTRDYYTSSGLTDVLSFQTKQDNFPAVMTGLDMGEIVICPSQVAANARKGKKLFKDELAWVLIHGLLHLLGYEHEKGGSKEKAMRAREDIYLKKLNLAER